jgi:hypothetical protein
VSMRSPCRRMTRGQLGESSYGLFLSRLSRHMDADKKPGDAIRVEQLTFRALGAICRAIAHLDVAGWQEIRHPSRIRPLLISRHVPSGRSSGAAISSW